jgi:hypothetical protein
MTKILMIHDVNGVEPNVAIVDNNTNAIEDQIEDWSQEWDMPPAIIAQELTFYNATALAMRRKVTYE